VTMLALAVMAAGCGPSAERAALRQGGDAAAPCIERFHDQGHTYAECVRYVAARFAGDAAPRQRLGALTQGWFTADLAARQSGDTDAAIARTALLADADRLQRELRVSDAALCELLAQSCATLAKRRAILRDGGA
jgi:hypothetical protein